MPRNAGNGLLYARRSGQGDLEPDGEAMASVRRMPRGRTISPRRASREPPPKECIHVGLRLPLAVTADAGYPGRSSQVARKRRHLIDLARVEGHPAVIWITLPKIRDEIFEDAATLGGMGFSAHFGQRDGGWFPVTQFRGRFFAVRAGIFESFRHRYAGGGSSFGFPRARQAPGITTALEWHLLPA